MNKMVFRRHFRAPRGQRGVVLPVALFIMLIVTLLSVSTMQTTTIDLKVVQNRQARMQTERAVERAFERIINEASNFTNVSALPLVQDSSMGTWVVTVERPYCISSVDATGYSVNAPLVPQYNVFAFEACATDTITGARVVMQHGVRMLMLAGNCNPHPTDDPADPCV